MIGVGTVIGHYIVEKLLGQGGMGAVYLANQVSMNRKVALKVLKPAKTKDKKSIEKFLDEARKTASLNHPNIVPVHDAGFDENLGIAYFTMEYVEGPTIGKLVAKQGIPPKSHSFRIAREIAIGLGHAHENGIIHRDLKPDNILLTKQAVAKVTDLGLASDRFNGSYSNRSNAIVIVGTPEFSSPEQLRNPNNITPASDVFSLGVCLFFMLFGYEPFSGETLMDLAVKIATEDLPFVDSLEADEQALLAKLMAKDPVDRPQNGNEAAKLITSFLSNRKVTKIKKLKAAPSPIPAPITEIVTDFVPDIPSEIPNEGENFFEGEHFLDYQEEEDFEEEVEEVAPPRGSRRLPVSRKRRTGEHSEEEDSVRKSGTRRIRSGEIPEEDSTRQSGRLSKRRRRRSEEVPVNVSEALTSGKLPPSKRRPEEMPTEDETDLNATKRRRRRRK